MEIVAGGAQGLRRGGRPDQVLWLLILGVAAAGLPPLTAAGTPRDCHAGCILVVKPVCGANGVSYMNPCIAECSGKQLTFKAGYCQGDNVRFAPPEQSGTAPKERAAAVMPDIMTKFASEGFSFMGHAPLSRAPIQHKVLRREAAFVADKVSKAAASATKQASAAVRAAAKSEHIAGAAATGTRRSAAAPSPSVVVLPNTGVAVLTRTPGALAGAGAPPPRGSRSSQGSTIAGSTTGGIGPQAFDANAALNGIQVGAPTLTTSGSAGLVEVAILRSDRAGNVYTKKYKYNPAGSNVWSYPPQAPTGLYSPTGKAPFESALIPNSGARVQSGMRGSSVQESGKSTLAAKAPATAARSSNGANVGERKLLANLWSRITRPFTASRAAAASSSGDAASGRAGYNGAAVHRALSVIGADTRVVCPTRRFPYSTLGQLSARAADGTFLCSGALITQDRVLTAAHCVWDDRQAHAFFKDLSFSPAQWKTKAGVIEHPEGPVDWEHVTTFKAYTEDPDLPSGLQFDIAMIKLVKPLGIKYGWLGIRADGCGPSERLNMTLAGYPGDDPFTSADDYFLGGCYRDTCSVSMSCRDNMTSHTCDSYIGQSGAPMFDPSYYVRMVHTLGVLQGISADNSGVRISKFILDQVMVEWTGSNAQQGSDGQQQAARWLNSQNSRGR